jgi:glutamate carboxypeptidase
VKTFTWPVVLIAVGLSLGGAAAVHRATPDPIAAIAAYVDTHHAEALSLLESAVNINSGTMNLDGVRRVGQLLRAEFDALGFTTTWIDGAAWERAGHLVADHSRPGPRIVLIGHLDTVYEADSPFQKFERLSATEARGPGIIDMKGGDVIIVQALKALNDAGILDAMNVVVVMTGDEEEPGKPLARARDALVRAAAGADIAIGFEDGPGDPRYAVTARRGSTRWRLEVAADTAHSSQIFRDEVGSGAIFEAARILTQFRERLAGQEHLTFNPGLILGGTSIQRDAARSRGAAEGKDNVIAGQAVVTGDLRALSLAQFEQAKRAMQTVTASSPPHARAALIFEDGYPPMPPREGNTRLLELYSRSSLDLRLGPVAAISPDRAGAADVSFVADRVKMALDGIGLMGRDGHTAHEAADLNTLSSQTKRAALLLARLANGQYAVR